MRLADLETGLVDYLKGSSLAADLRQVDALPDLEGDSLVSKFGADAPAVYVALGNGRMDPAGLAEHQIGIACITRNSRSHAARHGDGRSIGLLDLVESVMILVGGAQIDGILHEVLGWDTVASDALYRKGLYAAVVQVRACSLMPLVVERWSN
jgi:hypothetical protein